MTPFTFNTSARIIFEDGSANRLGALCATDLGSTVMMVTDQGLVSLGLIDAAKASLEDAGCTVVVFDSVEPDPSQTTVLAALKIAQDLNATGIVGFGGGSSMDVAKLIALLAGSGEKLDDAWGVGNAKGPRLPLVLVPTTAGTGSEVTPVSIITVGDDLKLGVVSPIILPDYAVLDASLTTGLPAAITAATGVDAMVHAIEAYASKSPNNNTMSRVLAVEALRLLGANIETAVFEGTNTDARGQMLLGSMLAGMAFANSPVAAVHALAYPIGGMFHIPHGLSNALVLPHVLRFNAAEIQNGSAELYARLAPYVFSDLDQSQGAQGQCSEFIERLEMLCEKLGLETKLRQVGIPEDALEKMASESMKQGRLLVNNPREVSQTDALAIYRAAY